MSKIAITLPIYDFDHLAPLVYGDVEAEGIDLKIERGAFITKTVIDPTVLAGEISLSGHLIRLAKGDQSFVGIPAFVYRTFRHRCFYVRRDSGLRSFQDLTGKRVGMTGWGDTGNTWSRAAMREQGVQIDSISWSVGSVDDPKHDPFTGRLAGEMPANVQKVPAGRTLLEMLLADELDAIVSSWQPKGLYEPDSPITRLFPDFRAVEQDYLRRTGIFPAHHIVGIRREVFDRNPWIARSLFLALEQSKLIWQKNRLKLMETTPWLLAEIEESMALIGPDWYPYGVEPNRKMLETLCAEQHAQGMVERPLEARSIFAEFEEVMRGRLG